LSIVETSISAPSLSTGSLSGAAPAASGGRSNTDSETSKRGCDLCRTEAAQAKRELRARKRGLTPVPSVPLAEPGTAEMTSTVPAETAGPVVRAVEADIAGLGELRGYQCLAAAAVAMARILDDHRLATTAPSAAKQLASLLDVLHRAAPPKRGRLAVVQKMSASSRPDAG
jgi:hypothetical protein